MTDIILVVILGLILGAAVAYMIRAKKRGVKCIGCPEGASCSSKNSGTACSGCSGCNAE